LGKALYSQGRYEDADGHFQEIIALTSSTPNIDFIDAYNGLGITAYYRHQYTEAEGYYATAMSLLEDIFGREHRMYPLLLNNRGELYSRMGQYEAAERLLKEAIEQRQSQFNALNDHSLSNLGLMYMRQARYAEAERYLKEALAQHERYLDQENHIIGNALSRLQHLYLLRGDLDKSIQFALRANSSWQRVLAKSAAYLTERELAMRFRNMNIAISQGTLYTLASRSADESIKKAAYDDALFSKGFLLNITSQVSKIAAANPGFSTTYYQIKAYHRQLAAEYLKAVPDQARIEAIESKANSLEKELIREVAGYGEICRQTNWQEVQAKLRDGEAAVEFIRYDYVADLQSEDIRYAALLLRPGAKAPIFLPLFEEAKLLSLLEQGANFRSINSLYLPPAKRSGQEALYELLWQPLEAHLRGVHTVYCSPAGLLHRVNLGAAAGQDGTAFADKYKVVRLGSTRQLALPSHPDELGQQAYVVGGVRYAKNDAAIASANSSRGLRSPSKRFFHPDNLPLDDLTYLPNSLSEALEISDMLQSAGTITKLDTGYYATEERFRSIGANTLSPRILHIATHGFAFPDPKADNEGDPWATAGIPAVFKRSENPMLRAGLLFAGAKEAWSGGQPSEGLEDGICTAYEISQMNLANTELVVLSACQSGLGDIKGNEGVYGLQRAFKIAGAKYLIMSLWEVNDQTTRAFMTTFYRQWLENGLAIPDAFRAAEAAMKDRYPDAPYHWAGFVLVE
jgi:CHAT domain-containing protein